MILILKKEDVDPNASPHEVEEIHDAVLSQTDCDLSKVASFTLLRPCDYSSLDIFCSFEMAHCAKILQDKDKVPDSLVPSLLSLYAGLVECNGDKYTDYCSRYYSALPSLFVHFAYNARVNIGHRLLEQCA